jgi:urate oxidase / 2-oxo-4-hydroxy-4-carboxy-5-ureidoimidazoline decarboxylase
MTSARITYGKLEVPVQRVSAAGLLAARVSMEVLGQRFLAAYTEGDNSAVVATDTMKNVILRRALDYEGVALEGLLDQLGHGFLETYPEMEGLALRAVDLGFEPVSEKLFRMVDAERAVAELHLARGADGAVERRAARSGLEGFRLLKTTGSAFTRFARDGDTTLPERGDRPLFIHLDVHWRYLDPSDAGLVTPAAVREVVLEIFDTFVSESIQHLVHEMGTTLLDRFAALSSVSFRGENHTFDPVPGSTPGPDGHGAYTAAFPAWGLITLELTR